MRKSLLKAWPYMVLLLLAGILLAYFDIRFIFLIKENLDAAFSGQAQNFGTMARRLIMVQLLIFPAGLLVVYLRGLVKKTAMVAMKKDYLRGLFKKSISEFKSESTMKYMSELTNDMNSLEINFVDSLMEIILGFTNIAAAVYVVVNVNINILFMVAVMFVFVGTVSAALSKPMEKLYTERSVIQASFTKYIREALSAFQIIKGNNLMERVRDNYTDKAEGFLAKSYDIDLRSSWISGLQQLLFMTPTAALMVYMIYLTKVGMMTVGGVLAIANTLERLIGPVNIIMERLPKVVSSVSVFKKLDETLEETGEENETVELKGFNDSIEFRHVTFSYTGDREIFEDLDVTLEKGRKYLITGPSGGGKSTFLRLLRKYIPQKSGEILIDGIPLKDVKKLSYYKNIATVEQEVFLFQDTLLNNLTLYKEVPTERINDALDKAGLHDFILNLENGLSTMLYDNGKNISGGERSRIAIARALISGATMLILDEPFASLDYSTGREIERTILTIGGITVVNVTHVTFSENLSLYDMAFKVENGTLSDNSTILRNQEALE